MSAIDADSAATGGLFSRRYRSLTFGALTLISLVAFEYVAVATAMPTSRVPWTGWRCTRWLSAGRRPPVW
ncbi:hypothetical protein [Saccharopolyspora sp. NPDC050642]|uniref:hypothetical protein n=1 Tax=Saccharopolyspora sp. NPDC050642 TaxID=3157099 RepID=UPI00340E5C09